jgi:DNA-damage-inducible protein D
MSRGKDKKPVARQGDKSLIDRLLIAFDHARQTDDHGREYWSARQFNEILGYSSWQRFEGVVERAKAVLTQEGGIIEDHFNNVVEVITAGKGAQPTRKDIELSRRACYLIGINGDPTKVAAIAAVQMYFVVQARKQEIQEMLELAGPDRERLIAAQKHAATEQALKDESAPRLKRPEDHFDQIKRRGEKALFNKSPDAVREDMGIPKDREIADFADPLLVKGMDFAKSVTLRQTRENNLQGVNAIGKANEDAHTGVRRVITDSGQFPEKMKKVEDVKLIAARAERQRLKLNKLNKDGLPGKANY